MVKQAKVSLIVSLRDKTTRGLAKLKERLSAGLKRIAVAGVAAAGVMSVVIKRTINMADEAGKLSASLGVTVEQLTALRHAADLSGVSAEALQTGMGRLARNVSDASHGLSTAVRAFDQLGISVKDSSGNLRSQTDILDDVADAFAGMEDGTRKTAIAQELFGRAGATMIPMLNAGSAGLKNMTDEAAGLGLVIGGKTAKMAADFNDNLTRLRAAGRGFVNQITERLLPILLELSQIFLDARQNVGTLDGAFKFIENTLRTVISTGALLRGVFLAIGDVIAGVFAALSFAARGQFRNAWEAIKIGAADAAERTKTTVEEVVFVWEELGDAAERNATRVNAATTKLTEEHDELAAAAKRAADEVARVGRGLQGQQQAVTTVRGRVTEARGTIRTDPTSIRTPGAPGFGQGPQRINQEDVGFAQQFAEAMLNAVSASGELGQVLSDITTNTLRAFGDAVSEAFSLLAQGAVGAGAAFVAAMLGALSAVAKGFGEFFLARATGALAQGILGDPRGFAAAAKFAAAATAMFALSGVLSGVAANATAGGGGAAGSAGAATSQAVATTQERRDVTIELTGDSIFDLSNPRNADRFGRVLEEVTGARVRVRKPGDVFGRVLS